MNTCELCRGSLSGQGGHRCGGLDLCDSCWHGDSTAIVKSRGFEIRERTWQTNIRTGQRTHRYYNLQVIGALPRIIGIEAVFQRETLEHKLIKLFAREIQVGDPLFDDHIYIRTKDREELSGLLASEGFQSVVMELVTGMDRLKITGNEARATVSSPEEIVEAHPARRSMAVALHYLDAYLDSAAAGPTSEPPR